MSIKKHPLYGTWKEMKRRCLNKNCKDYKYYGARNITVCQEWKKSFHTFLKDMGEKPSPHYSIDRIDNSKGYSKKNCRWATRREQVLNRRIKDECLRGHKWTKDTEMWTKSRTGKTRRCKICYENRIKRQVVYSYVDV